MGRIRWIIVYASLLFLWYVLGILTFFSEPYGLYLNEYNWDISVKAGGTTFLLIAGSFLIIGVVTVFYALSGIDIETPGNIGGFLLLLMVPPGIGWMQLFFGVIFRYWQISLIVVTCTMMVGLPILWFIKELPHTLKKGVVVGYFVSFFAWIVAIIVGIVGHISAILGVCVFLGTGIVGLTYLITRSRMKKREEERKKAVVWELKDQLEELKEQLGRSAITQEEYEQKKNKLLEGSPELKEQLEYGQEKKKLVEEQLEEVKEQAHMHARSSATRELESQLKEMKEQLSKGAITQGEYEQEREKLVEGLTELKKQLFSGVINRVEYEQKKKRLLEKSEV